MTATSPKHYFLLRVFYIISSAAIILGFLGISIVIVWIIGKSTIFNVYFNRMGGNIFS